MKNPLLWMLLLLFPLMARPQGLQDLSCGTPETFDIVTWNIEDFPKLGQLTVDSVTQVISSLDMDLWALQEISSTFGFQVVVDNLPGYEGFLANGSFKELAFIYKTGVVEVDTIYEIYTNLSREFPRPPLVMEMSYLGNDMVVINNHLKCCGNGAIDLNDPWDEERRRLDAMVLLKQFIDTQFPNDKVILLGDLNDRLNDLAVHNVFQPVLDDTLNYYFADEAIAYGNNQFWSFPSFPSHIDHILITNELFNEFAGDSTQVVTIRPGDFLSGGFTQYSQIVSDHRPVALKLDADQLTGLTLANSPKGSLQAFPNPFSDRCTFEFPPQAEAGRIDIFDLQGKQVATLPLEPGSHQLSWIPDATSSPSHLYFAILSFNNIHHSSIRVLRHP